MMKQCPVCNNEFKRDKLSQKYCSEECRLARVREYDRIRKQKEREEERAIRLIENERIQQAKIEAREQVELERLEAKEQEHQDLIAKANEGDPLARMTLAKRFSLEYWEAYKDYEIANSLKYDKKPIRYVNGISVHTKDFAEKVMFTIEEYGFIKSELVRT